jgi:hypothetical protein
LLLVAHCGGLTDRTQPEANPIADPIVDVPPKAATVLDAAVAATSDAGCDATLSDASGDVFEEALEAGDAADALPFIQLTDDGSCPQEIARFFYEDAGSCAANQPADNAAAARCLSVPFDQLPCHSGCFYPQLNGASVDFSIVACDQHGRGIPHGYGTPVGQYCCVDVIGFNYGPGLSPIPYLGGGPASESDWCVQSLPGYESNLAGYAYFATGDFVDTDFDGALDITDNCPTVTNVDQTDSDEDGIGDACDNCPYTFNPDQTSTMTPGIGDACNCAARPSPPLGANGCPCADGTGRNVIDAGSQCKMVAKGQSSCGDGGDVCGRCLPLTIGSL